MAKSARGQKRGRAPRIRQAYFIVWPMVASLNAKHLVQPLCSRYNTSGLESKSSARSDEAVSPSTLQVKLNIARSARFGNTPRCEANDMFHHYDAIVLAMITMVTIRITERVTPLRCSSWLATGWGSHGSLGRQYRHVGHRMVADQNVGLAHGERRDESQLAARERNAADNVRKAHPYRFSTPTHFPHRWNPSGLNSSVCGK